MLFKNVALKLMEKLDIDDDYIIGVDNHDIDILEFVNSNIYIALNNNLLSVLIRHHDGTFRRLEQFILSSDVDLIVKHVIYMIAEIGRQVIEDDKKSKEDKGVLNEVQDNRWLN